MRPPATSTPCHRDIVPTRHESALLPEPLDQLRQGLFALQVDGQIRALTQSLPSRHRPASRREQSKHSTARGLRQFHELVEQLLGGPVSARQRQVGRHVADALATVIEGRSDVNAVPGTPETAMPTWAAMKSKFPPIARSRR